MTALRPAAGQASRSHVHGRMGATSPEPDPPRHRIGQAAARIGVSSSALRLWERQGLVRPARTRSGYRLYSEADVHRLQRVRHLRSQHLNATGIRRLLPGVSAAPPGRGSLDGGRLRDLRHGQGLSLRAAARRAGLSPSFLSAVERNVSGASVATLQRLTRAYGVTMLALFDAGLASGRHVRPSERRLLDLPESGVRIEQLAQGATMLEPQLFVMAPGATSDGAYAHDGEEFLYVLDGAVTLWLGAEQRYRLTAGDALTFPSTMPHRWRNRADGETRLLWINTPPTF